jgi:hypothetical protein
MGKAHRSARPKGYMSWSPKPESQEIIDQVRTVIRQGRTGTYSVRFIFYRLVANYGYDKTERAYKNLAELLVKARRAQMIPFGAIVDTGTETAAAGGFQSKVSFLNTIRSWGDYFSLDKQIDQPYFLEVWAEDAGSVPMLANIVSDWDLPVYGTGGFSSVTVTHEVADRIRRRYEREGRPTVILHVGDYDPSGESIFLSMCQDIGSFISADLGGFYYEHSGRAEDSDEQPVFIPHRVALTEDQVDRYSLPTAPAKVSDSRSVNWEGETVQVQALSEDQMEDLVTEAVMEYLDEDVLDEVQQREREDKEILGTKISDAIDRIIEEVS